MLDSKELRILFNSCMWLYGRVGNIIVHLLRKVLFSRVCMSFRNFSFSYFENSCFVCYSNLFSFDHVKSLLY